MPAMLFRECETGSLTGSEQQLCPKPEEENAIVGTPPAAPKKTYGRSPDVPTGRLPGCWETMDLVSCPNPKRQLSTDQT